MIPPLEDRLEASCTRHGHTPCLCRLAAWRIRDLKAALQFYADKHHLRTPDVAPKDAEDGSIARAALEERE